MAREVPMSTLEGRNDRNSAATTEILETKTGDDDYVQYPASRRNSRGSDPLRSPSERPRRQTWGSRHLSEETRFAEPEQYVQKPLSPDSSKNLNLATNNLLDYLATATHPGRSCLLSRKGMAMGISCSKTSSIQQHRSNRNKPSISSQSQPQQTRRSPQSRQRETTIVLIPPQSAVVPELPAPSDHKGLNSARPHSLRALTEIPAD